MRRVCYIYALSGRPCLVYTAWRAVQAALAQDTVRRRAGASRTCFFRCRSIASRSNSVCTAAIVFQKPFLSLPAVAGHTRVVYLVISRRKILTNRNNHAGDTVLDDISALLSTPKPPPPSTHTPVDRPFSCFSHGCRADAASNHSRDDISITRVYYLLLLIWTRRARFFF